MATKFAVSDGNFTSTIWAAGATGTGSELLTFNSGWPDSGYSTQPTTTAAYNPAFTITNGETIDGVLLCMETSSSSPSGTVTCILSDDGGVTETRSKTLNIADIFSGTAAPYNVTYVLFVFDTPLVADGGNDYRIGVKATDPRPIYIVRTNTTNDWLHALRTTTTGQTAAADDDLIVVTNNSSGTRAVTMNNNSSTKYGRLLIGIGGSVAYVTNANTQLRLGYPLHVGSYGSLSMGTVGTPVSRAYTASLEFEKSNYDRSHIWGDFVAYGESRTSGKNVPWCLLSADATNGATSLTVDRDTGWKSGDTVIVAPTGIDRTLAHRTTLNGDAGVSSLTLTAGLNQARSGTAPMQAEVINLTRNVKLTGIGTYKHGWRVYKGATFTLKWTEVSNLYAYGTNAILLYSVPNFEYCAFDLMGLVSGNAINVQSLLGQSATLVIRHCVFGRESETFGMYGIIECADWTYDISITDNVMIAMTGSNSPIGISRNAASNGVDISRNRMACTNGGFSFNSVGNMALWTVADNVVHTYGASTSTSAVQFALYSGALYSNLVIDGLIMYNCVYSPQYAIQIRETCSNITIKDSIFLGTDRTIYFESAQIDNLLVSNCTFSPTTDRTLSYVFYAYQTVATNVTFDACTNTGSNDGYAGNGTTGVCMLQVQFRGCTHAATFFTADANTTGYIAADGGTVHKRWTPQGLIQAEGTTYRTAAPAVKLTPSSASAKLAVSFFSKIYASGTVTPSLYVRKNSSYAGNAPRLIQRASPQLGTAFNTDVVLDTLSVGADTWEELTGTSNTATYDGVVEFVIDCDGTVGNVFVDDFTAQ